MFHAASLAFNQMLSPPFRSVLWKSLGLTILLLIVLWALVQGALAMFLVVPYPWLETAIAWITGAGMIIGMSFFIAPVMSIFAGIFLDDIADVVEKRFYPQDQAGAPMPFMQSIGSTIRFFLVVASVNIAALILVLFFGLGVPIFFLANGYLLGREYFELAAVRHRTPADARQFRADHALTVFLAGLLIAVVLAIPIVNLLTPLFATAFMVHLHKMLSGAARPALAQ